MSLISTEDASQNLVPFKLPVRRFFWLPLGIAGVLTVVVFGALLFVSWHALSRIEPVRTHLERISHLRGVAFHMEEVLFGRLRRTEDVSPEQFAGLRDALGALSSNGHYLDARTPSRLRHAEGLLESVPAKPADTLFEALAELRSALADERRSLGLLMDKLAHDTRTEMDLSVLLAGVLPLFGLAALFMLRQRVRQPLESLGDLLARLAERDYRPVSDAALAESATMLQPVFRSYNDLVHRLQKLETEHSDREHTLEQEVRRATGALLAQSRQLARSERLAAVGAVSAGLAHELRNPLAGIQMACAKLQRVLADSDQSARLDAVIAELKRLNRLLTERLEAARHAPEPLSQVPLKETVEELVSLMRYQIPDSIRLRTRIEETFICPLPDGGLRQALLNLILNAAQSMEGEEGEVEIRAVREAETVALSVSDTGPGFPPDMLTLGVRPFASGRVGGTGLGLAMVRRFTEDIHAGLELANRDPRGARVTLRLPCPGAPVQHGH